MCRIAISTVAFRVAGSLEDRERGAGQVLRSIAMSLDVCGQRHVCGIGFKWFKRLPRYHAEGYVLPAFQAPQKDCFDK